MKELLGLELKKIYSSKLTFFVMLASLLITSFLYASPALNEIAVDKNGKQYMGRQALELEKQYANEMAGPLTDEKATESIREFQKLFENPDNVEISSDGEIALKEDANLKYVQPYYSYYKLINEAYILPSTVDMTFKTMQKLDIDNGANYYNARSIKISKMLNQEYEDWNFSPAEKNFWLGKTEKIQLPYEYGYCWGWDMFLKCGELFMVVILAICICIAPVFAGEYQTHMDSLILTAKYGKSKVIIAKILAAFLFGSIAFFIHAILALALPLAIAGTDGAGLPIQIINVICPYKLTMMSACVVLIITAYMVLLGMISFTLLLSTKLGTTFSTLIVDILIIFVPVFLSISETNGIWNHILLLLPYNALSTGIGDDYFEYFSYPLGNMVMDVVQVRVLLYIILAVILLPFTVKIFKRHQVR